MSRRFCLLQAGQASLAVDLTHVREVFKVESITPVPGMPPALAGVANLRGSVVPMVDVRPFLGLPKSSVLRYAAVVRHEGAQLGVLIDEVPQVCALRPGDTLDRSPCEPASDCPFPSDLVKLEGRVCVLVEVSTLLAAMEGTVEPVPSIRHHSKKTEENE